MCSTKLAVVVVGVAVLLAYSLYMPLPDGICEPRRTVVAIHKSFRLMKYAATLGSWLGMGTEVQLIRRLQNAAAVAFDPDTATNSQVTVTDMLIQNVTVRVYHPVSAFTTGNKEGGGGEEGPLVPAVVYFHGGGWTIGSVIFYHPFTRWLALRTRYIVISVDYRLSPEHPYPAAYDDCLLVTEHVLRHGRQLRIDTTRVAVMGDSAGGNLAAAVALSLGAHRREVHPLLHPLQAQVLVYPVVQAWDFLSPSYLLPSPPVLSTHDMIAFWLSYLGPVPGYSWNVLMRQLATNNHTSQLFKTSVFQGYMNHTHVVTHGNYQVPAAYRKPESTEFGDLRVFNALVDRGFLDPYAMPLAANSVGGAPGTAPDAYVFTAEHDILRDEGVAYANRLRSEGVRVVHRHARDGFHGMLTCVEGSPMEIPSATAAANHIATFLTDTLGDRPATAPATADTS